MLKTISITPDMSIAILTGAGISAESGLETFRGGGGLWCGQRVEDVATPQAFLNNPKIVHDFYNMRRNGLRAIEIKPNPAHIALAELEQNHKGDVLIITQNIDNLHERGGTQNILHMHGEALKAFCISCNYKTDCKNDLSIESICDKCSSAGTMRPDIVWFGEMPYHMDKIEKALSNCDLFLSIGTSGHVYPAAGFVNLAGYSGAHTVELNLEPSNVASAFNEQIYGPASKTVPEIIQKILRH